MDDKALYGKILGVNSPWEVTDVTVELQKREVVIKVEYNRTEKSRCPVCGQAGGRYDHQKRRWRHLDTCQLRTIVECDVPRHSCKEHGVKLMRVPWAEGNSHFTAMFEAMVISWLKNSSIKAVAELCGLSWDEADGIQQRAVERGLKRRRLKPAKHLAIDETSFQKRHEYVTVILDRERDLVVDVLDDRKAETLSGWLQMTGKRRLRAIKTVSLDMWDPFISALKEHIPDAENKICFDRYHVAQHLGKALDKVRNEEHRRLLRENGDSPLLGTRYDWLRNAGLIDNRSRRDFNVLCRSQLKTARAWAIKETASRLWGYVYRGQAEKMWKRLLNWISHCRLEPMKKVGRMIKRYLWGILNAIVSCVSNAMAEAKNACIQRIKGMACGFRNRIRFKNAILFHLGGLDLMPNGTFS